MHDVACEFARAVNMRSSNERTCQLFEGFMGVATGSPSSLVTVNMTLRNGVIIRVCMGNTLIVRNSSK